MDEPAADVGAFAAAPGFPVYALTGDWIGVRALDFVAEFRLAVEDPFLTYGVWVGHVAVSGRAGVRVGTFSRDLAARAEPGSARLFDVPEFCARRGLAALLDLTVPGRGGQWVAEPRPGTVKAVSRCYREQALHHRDWPRVDLHLGDAVVEAPHWRHAGGWTGFIDTLPDVCVVLVGVGMSAGGLRLAQDTQFSGALPRATRPDSARDWHETIVPKPNGDSWHEDHVRVVTRG